jgi:hypothetical protein
MTYMVDWLLNQWKKHIETTFFVCEELSVKNNNMKLAFDNKYNFNF